VVVVVARARIRALRRTGVPSGRVTPRRGAHAVLAAGPRADSSSNSGQVHLALLGLPPPRAMLQHAGPSSALRTHAFVHGGRSPVPIKGHARCAAYAGQ